jgi:hypothetical protein
MSSNGLNEVESAADETEAGYRIMDEWLRIEEERVAPGFLLPSQDVVVAWCEKHAGAILLSANALLWAPIVMAMWQR